MKRLMMIVAMFAALGLAACDNKPTVINVPPSTPGPAGPAGAKGATGATGNEGAQGSQGKTGQSGDTTTVIVTPPAPESK